jgi:hypothetical protein
MTRGGRGGKVGEIGFCMVDATACDPYRRLPLDTGLRPPSCHRATYRLARVAMALSIKMAPCLCSTMSG